jgi:hypothetical protein
MLTKLKLHYKSWKDARFLKKHGCENWDQYRHRFDEDIFKPASRVTDYYHGYPYVYCIEEPSHYAHSLLYDNGPGGYRYGYHDIIDWCKKNCKHKHRADIHRVFNEPHFNEWRFNEIGGGDHLFFAFKDEKEYNWFLLRWS